MSIYDENKRTGGKTKNEQLSHFPDLKHLNNSDTSAHDSIMYVEEVLSHIFKSCPIFCKFIILYSILKKPLQPTEVQKQATTTMRVALNRRNLPTCLSKRQSNDKQDRTSTSTPAKKKCKFDGLSSKSKLLKKQQDNLVVDAAFKRFMAIRAANGGKSKHNDIQRVCNEYQKNNLGEVECWHLEYGIKQFWKGKQV
jgi:hypothetical protein